MSYDEGAYQMLSGIQHYCFCPRQWALIHIEMQWKENYLTADGRILHEKAHDSSKFEKRGDTLTVRALKISSATLGVSGECDVVEFKRNDELGVPLTGYEGKWLPYPVEYKRGATKLNDCDRLQLCAQAICLEEMLGCKIEEGALFYGEVKRREVCVFSEELRAEVLAVTQKMHALFERKHTPTEVPQGAGCASCSMKEVCLPQLSKGKRTVQEYIREALQ